MQLTNKYGSPSLEDIERVARDVNSKLVESLGEDLAGEIEIGMSSPVRSIQALSLVCGPA